ncbi:MAG: hypothetical protein WD039_09070 [Xanthobacteraceae bacterium]
MSARRDVKTFRALLILAAAMALSGCSHGNAIPAANQLAPEPAAGAPAPQAAATSEAPPAPAALPTTARAAEPPAPAKPMTREQASTDCWMKYEGSGLSLDQRLPLVEKCTAEKLKAAAR